MVTISPATQFASVTRVQSGHSETFSRTVTASPGPKETIESTTLILIRDQINLVLEPATTASADNILLEDGHFLLLNQTDGLGTDAGDNLITELSVEDATLLLEDATNDGDEVQSSLDKLLYEDIIADTEPDITITNGVTSATTSGFYSRKFNDKGFFYLREESADNDVPDVEITSVLGKTHLMHEFDQDTTSSYTFMYSVIVCFFKTETISETDPITGLTTQHEIKQPTECKTFSLSHDVLNDFSFAPAFVLQFYAPFD